MFQFKSWVYVKPNSGLCQFGANFLPVLGLTAIVQLTTRDFFFLQNSYLILTLANGLTLSWYIYNFGACCCLWLVMRGNDIGGPTAYSIYPHHYQIQLKMFVQYNIGHLDQCLNLVEVSNLVLNLCQKWGERILRFKSLILVTMLNNKLSKIEEEGKMNALRLVSLSSSSMMTARTGAAQSTSSSSGTKSSFSSRKAAKRLLMDEPIIRPGKTIICNWCMKLKVLTRLKTSQ